MRVSITWFLLLSITSLAPTAQANEMLSDRFHRGLTPHVLTFVSNAPQDALEERIAYLSKDISEGLTENQKRTIAVVEFADLKGNVTDFGRFIAEELITRLHQTKKFKVIERQLLNKVIAEQKLSLTGVVDQSSAQRLGKVLRVDAIASGTVTDLGKVLRVNARLIDTATGEIFAVASAEIAKDDAVMILVGGTNAPPKVDPTSLNGSPNTVHKTTVKDFVFEIDSCKLSKDGVVCEPTVTNNSSEDREVSVSVYGGDHWEYGKMSRAIDEFGGEYTPKSVRLGSVIGVIGSCLTGCAPITNTLIPRTPMKISMAFANVNPEANTIALLRVYFEWKIPRGGKFSADLRNIPIVK